MEGKEGAGVFTGYLLRPGLRGYMQRVGREVIGTDSEGLSNLCKVTQLVKGQRQDLSPGMASTLASALVSCTDSLSSRQSLKKKQKLKTKIRHESLFPFILWESF